MKPVSVGKVFFIGAGPGDADLITIRGQKLIADADVILYAGSLVGPEILKFASADAEICNSAAMKLKDQIAVMVGAARQGKQIARLHTGDPSIFGAIAEQIQALADEDIPYELIPGVSSAFAAAAALGIEYTLPEMTQTLILTRAAGRTPVPERERLRDLAGHRCSLVIFLSTGLIAKVVDELAAAGYSDQTPIAVVYRASWPDQKIVRGTLADISSKLEQSELTHQGLIVVSPALGSERSAPSRLYGGYQSEAGVRAGTAILALTAPAVALGKELLTRMPDAQLLIPERFAKGDESGQSRIQGFHEAIRQVLQDAFLRFDALVCIMASGIVVRELAPLLRNKHTDPAVVVMDAQGKYAISLLSGHEGGANRLARQIAGITGGQAVITTASDSQDITALDVLAKSYGWKMDAHSRLAAVMAAMVNSEPVGLIRDADVNFPPEVSALPWAETFLTWNADVSRRYRYLVRITCRSIPSSFWQEAPASVVCYPPVLVLGVGCNLGTPGDEIRTAIQETLSKNGLAIESVASVATITEKAGEPGLVELCKLMGWQMLVFSHEQIQQVAAHIPNPSESVQKALGVPGVAEPAALLASGAASLLVAKQKYPNVTVTVAVKGTAG
jgi:precorrin-4 C11-methyltransferase